MFQPPIQVDFRILPDYSVPDPENVDFIIGETDFSGNGILAGSVRILGDVGSGFIVDLHSEITGEKISSTVTDGIGTFEFTNLEKTEKFFMVFKDPSGLWEYRVSSRRNPV